MNSPLIGTAFVEPSPLLLSRIQDMAQAQAPKKNLSRKDAPPAILSSSKVESAPVAPVENKIDMDMDSTDSMGIMPPPVPKPLTNKRKEIEDAPVPAAAPALKQQKVAASAPVVVNGAPPSPSPSSSSSSAFAPLTRLPSLQMLNPKKALSDKEASLLLNLMQCNLVVNGDARIKLPSKPTSDLEALRKLVQDSPDNGISALAQMNPFEKYTFFLHLATSTPQEMRSDIFSKSK